MKSTVRRSDWMVKLVVLLLVFLLIGAWFYREINLFREEGYLLTTSLKAELVQKCLEADQSTGIHWAELAAYYHLIGEMPEKEEVINQASVLAESAKGYKQYFSMVLSERQLTLYLRYVNQLKRFGYYFSPQYVFPVPRKGTWFEDTWGADRDQGRRVHQGTDLFNEPNTPVVAFSGGTVEVLGWNRLGGKRVGIRDIHGNYIYYAHLSAYALGLKEGDSVTAGELVGYMGHTGNAEGTPDHLHFGIMTRQGQWINPYQFLDFSYKYGLE